MTLPNGARFIQAFHDSWMVFSKIASFLSLCGASVWRMAIIAIGGDRQLVHC